MELLTCTPKVLFNDKNGEKIVGEELWLFPPVLGGEKFILNRSARLVYELCKEGKSIKHILDCFIDHFPNVHSENLLKDILKILKVFWAYQLIAWDNNPFADDYRIYNSENEKVYLEKLVYDNFDKFFQSDLHYHYLNCYISDTALNTRSMVEKQVLEGSIVGFILYEGLEMQAKILLRFDNCNKIADVLQFDMLKSCSKEMLNWFWDNVGKNIFSIWNVKAKNIVYTLPISSDKYINFAEIAKRMGFTECGILKDECAAGDIYLFDKLLAI